MNIILWEIQSKSDNLTKQSHLCSAWENHIMVRPIY